MIETGRPTRLSVNLNPKTADQMRKIADSEGISITEVVRRAIGLLYYVHTLDADQELQVRREDGSYIKPILM